MLNIFVRLSVATWGQTSSLECLPAPATVVACGFCELFILPTDRLEEVLERFPGAKDLLHPIGQDEALHRAISWSLKDQVDEDSARLLIKVVAHSHVVMFNISSVASIISSPPKMLY